MLRDLRNLALAGVTGALVLTLWHSQPWIRAVEAQVVTTSPAPVLDYRTVGADFTALAATLTDLGNDGWQVESILHTDQVVETGGDGVSHLLARRVEVVASRPRAK